MDPSFQQNSNEQKPEPEAEPQNSPIIPPEDYKQQLVENLKEERDRLRGTLQTAPRENKRIPKKLKVLAYTLVIFLSLGLIYQFIVRPATKPKELEPGPTQSSFVLPSDFSSKTSEEKNALQIIEAARKNDSTKLIATWLDKAKVAQTEEQFKKLVLSYSTSTDGATVELIEKKVGKKNPAQETAFADGIEYEAASLIYKSKYFNKTNSIYTKINIYKPDAAQDVWKMYLFEFKEGDQTSPLKADLEVVTETTEEVTEEQQ